MNIFQNIGWTEFIITLLVGEFIVLSGNYFYELIKSRYFRTKYGGWKVSVTNKEEPIVEREVSASKIREILDEDSDLSVFIKGIISPYGNILVDPVTAKKVVSPQRTDYNVLTIDHGPKLIRVNLDEKNFSPKSAPQL